MGKLASRSAKIRAIIGNDYYDLAMKIDQLIEFQDRCGVGPLFAMRRMVERNSMYETVGDFRVEYVLETIRLGLVGGGMNPIEAVKLTDKYVRQGFIMDYLEVAAHTLYAALHGPEEEPVPEAEGKADPEAGESMAEVESPTPSP